jgi:hypothetical protein
VTGCLSYHRSGVASTREVSLPSCQFKHNSVEGGEDEKRDGGAQRFVHKPGTCKIPCVMFTMFCKFGRPGPPGLGGAGIDGYPVSGLAC